MKLRECSSETSTVSREMIDSQRSQAHRPSASAAGKSVHLAKHPTIGKFSLVLLVASTLASLAGALDPTPCPDPIPLGMYNVGTSSCDYTAAGKLIT